MDTENPEVIAHPAVDEACGSAVRDLDEMFPRFRFVVLAVDSESVYAAGLTYDRRRMCIHQVSKILGHFAEHAGQQARRLPHRDRSGGAS